MAFVPHTRRRRSTVFVSAVCDTLESRQLLAAVTVNAATPGRAIDSRLSGTNLATWQYELNTSRMQTMVRDAGLKLFRIPGGSAADEFHFTTPPPYNGYDTVPIMAKNVEAAGGNAIVTVDYGSGSPQEAAAMLAYLNAPVGSTANIGIGQTWDTTTSAWVNKDYKTAGYWAGLRAARTLSTDDGLNFLRQNHATPWSFSYYEIGNEEYATWEADHHDPTGRGGRSPSTYIGFAKALSTLASQIDPNVKIGIDVTPPLRYNVPNANWTRDLLVQSATQGFSPGFLSDHIYVTSLSDQNLLLHSVNDPAYKLDNFSSSWANRASYFRNLLTTNLGAAGASVQLMLTEFNSDINTKQAANLVGGLWAADALGGLLQTEYTAAVQWDLTNGYNALSTPDTTRYGWREGVDMGLIGTGSGSPASGAYVPYPVYFAQQLFSKLDRNGSFVLPVTSNDPNLATYAVKGADGHVRILIINKSATAAISGTFTFNGFTPAPTATQFRYGIAEDTAQSLTTDGHSSLTTTTLTTGITSTGLTQSFPAYSMSVIDLSAVVRPKVSIGDVAVAEGDVGTTTLLFPVSLDLTSPYPIIVSYSTTNGTAQAGSDYAATSGSITVAPGQTNATISVLINGDTILEPNETVLLNIASSSADVIVANATGTIQNDDVAAPMPLPLPTMVFAIDANSATFGFDRPLNATTLSVADLQITNLTTGDTSAGATGVTLSTDNTSISFALPSTLADGNYRFRLPAGSVAGGDGSLGAVDADLEDPTCFINAGDANHDRNVNFSDLLILAQNFGKLGQTMSQGNFDYSPDGMVDFADLLILAQKFGATLPPLTTLSAKGGSSRLKSTRAGTKRVADGLLA